MFINRKIRTEAKKYKKYQTNTASMDQCRVCGKPPNKFWSGALKYCSFSCQAHELRFVTLIIAFICLIFVFINTDIILILGFLVFLAYSFVGFTVKIDKKMISESKKGIKIS